MNSAINEVTKLEPGLVVPDSQNITVEKLRSFIPKGYHASVTEDIVKMIKEKNHNCKCGL